VSNAIGVLLERAPGPAGVARPKPEQVFAERMALAAAPKDPAVTIFLYRIAVSGGRRFPAQRMAEDGATFRGSLPVDLHYLLTAWGKDAPTQQIVLGWAMRTLEEARVLPAALLNLYQGGGDGLIFSADESVELTWEAMTAQEWSDVWEVAKQNIQPSIAYVARGVSIDALAEEGGGLVTERELGYGTLVEEPA
jgi:hypothetical protein